MFLSADEIRQRLEEQDLVIDPWDLGDIHDGFVALHFGPHVVPADDALKAMELQSSRLGIGEPATVPPGLNFAFSLEYLAIPLDLLGFIHPVAGLARLGLITPGGLVQGGWRGRLTIQLLNIGREPVSVRGGERLVNLALAETTASTGGATQYSGVEPKERDYIAELREKLLSREESVRSPGNLVPLWKSLLRSLDSDDPGKGQMLETFVVALLGTIKGLRIVKVNARLKSESLDIVVANDITFGFWRLAGSPIVVECKNWSEPAGAPQVGILAETLRTMGGQARTGVLVSVRGITGKRLTDARLKVRELRQRGFYILVVDKHDLREMVERGSPAEVLERKFDELHLI